jgi:hypothetical protein
MRIKKFNENTSTIINEIKEIIFDIFSDFIDKEDYPISNINIENIIYQSLMGDYIYFSIDIKRNFIIPFRAHISDEEGLENFDEYLNSLKEHSKEIINCIKMFKKYLKDNYNINLIFSVNLADTKSNESKVKFMIHKNEILI